MACPGFATTLHPLLLATLLLLPLRSRAIVLLVTQPLRPPRFPLYNAVALGDVPHIMSRPSYLHILAKTRRLRPLALRDKDYAIVCTMTNHINTDLSLWTPFLKENARRQAKIQLATTVITAAQQITAFYGAPHISRIPPGIFKAIKAEIALLWNSSLARKICYMGRLVFPTRFSPGNDIQRRESHAIEFPSVSGKFTACRENILAGGATPGKSSRGRTALVAKFPPGRGDSPSDLPLGKSGGEEYISLWSYRPGLKKLPPGKKRL